MYRKKEFVNDIHTARSKRLMGAGHDFVRFVLKILIVSGGCGWGIITLWEIQFGKVGGSAFCDSYHTSLGEVLLTTYVCNSTQFI